jgi:pimeloyl-ACP methyl ester carboxylesterase
MLQYHTLGAICGDEWPCVAHWSLEPSRKLLFFVHGFGGDATRTWTKFPELLQGDERWKGWDLFFYGYDSCRIRAGISAQLLGDQLSCVVENSGFADPWLLNARPKDFRYEEIWFVTHSLGAPVLRQVLITAFDRQATWIPISRLICFAPATRGARITQLLWLLGTTGGFMRVVYALLRYRLAVLDDIGVGSEFLTQLEHDTERVTAGSTLEPFYSRLTLFGTYENVVAYPPPFKFDTRVQRLKERDHNSVCKPRYLNDPQYFQLLREILP